MKRFREIWGRETRGQSFSFFTFICTSYFRASSVYLQIIISSDFAKLQNEMPFRAQKRDYYPRGCPKIVLITFFRPCGFHIRIVNDRKICNITNFIPLSHVMQFSFCFKQYLQGSFCSGFDLGGNYGTLCPHESVGYGVFCLGSCMHVYGMD